MSNITNMFLYKEQTNNVITNIDNTIYFILWCFCFIFVVMLNIYNIYTDFVYCILENTVKIILSLTMCFSILIYRVISGEPYGYFYTWISVLLVITVMLCNWKFSKNRVEEASIIP